MSSARKKMLLVTNLFPTPNAPTRGVFVYEMVKMLRDELDVTVVCPLPYFPRFAALSRFRQWAAYSEVPATYSFDGIEVHSPKYFMVPKLSERMHARLMYRGIRGTIARLDRERNFDLFNGQWMYPDAVAAAWIARDLKKPIVVGGHGSDVNFALREPAKRRQMLESFSIARHVTVVAEILKRKLVESGVDESKVKVISNGFDPAVFVLRPQEEARRALSIPVDRRMIVFVGRMLDAKGVIELVEAFKGLSAARADADLFFIGDGPARGRVERLIIDYNLGARAKVVGGRPHKEVAMWMSAADVFCLPSYSEGCPTVVLEALGSGRPVVATDVGGIPDLVNESNGILVSARNAVALRGALTSALDKRWKAEAIRSGVEALTWAAIAKKYANLFTGRSL